MSSVDVLGESRLLTNICGVTDTMKILCNVRTVTVKQKGYFEKYDEVWYHPETIANILSLSNI